MDAQTLAKITTGTRGQQAQADIAATAIDDFISHQRPGPVTTDRNDAVIIIGERLSSQRFNSPGLAAGSVIEIAQGVGKQLQIAVFPARPAPAAGGRVEKNEISGAGQDRLT